MLRIGENKIIRNTKIDIERERLLSFILFLFPLTILTIFDIIRENKEKEVFHLNEEREKVELNSETLPSLLKKLYKSQNQVLVRINGKVVLDLLELDGLRNLLISKRYPHVWVVSKSYGYELDVPPSIER